MSRIDIAEVKAFHRDLQQMNREARSGIQKMERAARNYAQDNSLKGQAVTTSKRYFSESYQTICDTVIEVMNESEHLLARYIQDFHSQVDPSPNAKIDAEMLQTAMSKVKSIERKKEHLQQSLSGSTAGLHEGKMQLFRVQLAEAVKQEKILEKYIHFEQSHGNFFSTIEELVHRSGKAVRQLLRETTFNEKTGTIHLPKGYGKSLKDLKKSLAKARGIDPKMEKKLKGYTVYAVVVPGANGKSTVMWVTEKDGLAVNEADLQSYLDKCGKYLDPKDYYVIPNEVLLQKINDAWKHGQYYLDGKVKFGAGAKGILSASAYLEDWAERFNKSEFGQAVLGLGLSVASIRFKPVTPKSKNEYINKLSKSGDDWETYFKNKYGSDAVERQERPSFELNQPGATKTISKDGTVTIEGKGKVLEVIDKRPYMDGSRPSFRKGVVETVWELAKRFSPDGKVRDPKTGEVIKWKPGESRKGVWDMGHVPTEKYSKVFARYKAGKMTPKQFRDWYNDPENYRPETPNTNRGHSME